MQRIQWQINETHYWSEQTTAQNKEKGMYVGLKQPHGDGERCVTPARAAAKETICFRVLSNQYVERSAYANVFKFIRENERFERGKLNSRCFHWCSAAMLESLRRASTWRLHTKHYNFQWYLSQNNSSSEYRTSPKLRHVVYLLLLYDIQFFDSIYQMVSDFIFYLRDN